MNPGGGMGCFGSGERAKRDRIADLEARPAAAEERADHYQGAFEQTTSPAEQCVAGREVGRGGCGTCAVCCKEVRERAEKAEHVWGELCAIVACTSPDGHIELQQVESLRAKAEILDRPFPIQDGPSVPWSVMLPHEAQSQENHGQSIKRIAERGGFGAAEAFCVVNDLEWSDARKKYGVEEMKRKWGEYASEVFGMRVERDEAQAEARRLRKVETAGQELCDFVAADIPGTWDEAEDQALAYQLVDAWDAVKKGDNNDDHSR